MFASSYFPASYFAPSYFPGTGTAGDPLLFPGYQTRLIDSGDNPFGVDPGMTERI